MWQFFKFTLASVLGAFIFTILSVLILVGIGSAFSADENSVDLKESSILKLDLNKPLTEQASMEEDPIADLAGPIFSNTERVGLIQILSAIERAKVDPKIKGVYLDISFPIAGYAQLLEIRDALKELKAAGKFVYAYAEAYSEKAYYLASVADEVYLNPAGMMDFNGISVQYMFFKKALDKLEIEPLVFRVGTYKSAVEPYIRENMSEESKAQTRSFIGAINDLVFQQIAESRKIPLPKLHRIADSLQAYDPKKAAALGLIKLAYWDEVSALLKKKTGVSATDELHFVSLKDYLHAKNPIPKVESSDKIGVLVAEGEIVGAKGMDGTIGSEDFIKELKKLRENKSIKAIVLRIDSPGGSSLASDVMWREIELTKKVKPVYASMSSVAASGGYYLAMACDRIVAQPSTITGSIGIFAQWLNLDRFLANKLGITQDQVQTNANAGFMGSLGTLTDFQKQVIQSLVNQGYETFTSKAAASRKMPIEKLKSIAGGRVWTGAQAKSLGLVDELGGLNHTIQLAAKKAGLAPGKYKVQVYPKAKTLLDELLSSGQSSEAMLKNWYQMGFPWANALSEWDRLKHRQGMFYLMPYRMELN